MAGRRFRKADAAGSIPVSGSAQSAQPHVGEALQESALVEVLSWDRALSFAKVVEW